MQTLPYSATRLMASGPKCVPCGTSTLASVRKVSEGYQGWSQACDHIYLLWVVSVGPAFRVIFRRDFGTSQMCLPDCGESG